MFRFIFGHPYVVLALALGLIASHSLAFYKGAGWQKDRMEARTIEKVITIREKQNEIRNNRPDAAGVVKRLRDSTF